MSYNNMLEFKEFLLNKKRKSIIDMKGSATAAIDTYHLHDRIDLLLNLIREFENIKCSQDEADK